MMGFFDLNIPYHESDRHVTDKSALRSRRLKLALKAMELGYTGVAYNRTIKGVMSESDRCSTSLFPISKLIPSSSSFFAAVKFHREVLNIPVSSSFRQYTRLTVVVDTPSQAFAINAGNPILRSYDVVAVRPMNQNIFDEACQRSQVDIIAIDFSEKLPFRLKQPMVKAAIKRGVFFEITYSGLIIDVQSRRQIISSCKLLVDWTRGKNLIFSSAAPSLTELRGPLDVSNLFSLLGLSTERARAAVSKNCRSVLANALRKKHFDKEAVKVEEVPVGGLVNTDETSLDAWLKWDPISSGEGDLLLEDLERSFSVYNTENVKSIKFTEDVNGLPVNGLQIKDLMGVTKKPLDGSKICKFLPNVLEIEKAVATETFEEHAKQSHLLDEQDSVSENQVTIITFSTEQGEAIHLSEGQTLVPGDKIEHHLKELPDANNFMPSPMETEAADVEASISSPMETEAAEVEASKEQMDADPFRDEQSKLPAYQGPKFLTEEQENALGLPEGQISRTDAPSKYHTHDTTSQIHLKDALPGSEQCCRASIEMPYPDNLVSIDFPDLLNKSITSSLSNFESLGGISLRKREGHAEDDAPNKVNSENVQDQFLAFSGPSAAEERCSEMVERSFKLNDDLPMKGFLNPTMDSGKSLPHYEIEDLKNMDSTTIFQGPVKPRAGRGKRKRYSPNRPLLFPFKRLWNATSSLKKSRK